MNTAAQNNPAEKYTEINGKKYIGSRETLQAIYNENGERGISFEDYVEEYFAEWDDSLNVDFHLVSDLNGIAYPVGANITKNIPIINSMVVALNSVLSPTSEVKLVCTGSSGAIISAIISTKIPCQIFHIKKDGELSHSNTTVYGLIGTETWLIDDFVSSGNTIRRMLKKVRESYDKSDVPLGVCVSGSIDIDRVKEWKDLGVTKIICRRITR